MEEGAVELPLDPESLAAARKLGSLEVPLCDECRGRVFGRLGHGFTNPERARSLDRQLGEGPANRPPSEEACAICGGAFARIPRWVERCVREAGDREWSTFRCGSRWDPERLAREESLWLEVSSSWGESLRSAFNRELGKAVATATGKVGEKEPADLVFLAEVPAGLVSVTVASVFFYGRYRKLDRTLPQTQWPCRDCRGRGCNRCQGSGKTYPTSVEEIIGAPVLARTGGSEHAFHGMGREDIDARMLGRGRPFVLEVRHPQRRSIPLGEVLGHLATEAAGRVELDILVPCSPREVERVKSANPQKSYRVVVAPAFPEAKLHEVLSMLEGRPLEQRTPTRVIHRRADLPRLRTVRKVSLVALENDRFTLDVRADAGTYIKEFVDGDGGRTRPSLSELLGAPAKVIALDVLDVHDAPPEVA